MEVKDYINELLIPLELTDSGQKALELMEEFKISHLPVVYKQEYLGLISEDILLNAENPFEPISKFELTFRTINIFGQKHIFDAFYLLQDKQLSLIPVLNQQEQYIGSITVHDVVKIFAELSAVTPGGSILVIAMKTNDYTLAELSRIIESNGAKILSSFVTFEPEDPTQLRVTVKLNQQDIRRVIAALERYDYNIVGRFFDSDEPDDNLKRLDQFFRYLNI